MMLTWKIFVTIISMVSLTFQMDPSGSSSSLPQFIFYEPWSGRYHPSSYNLYNHFMEDTDANKCFAIIRLYCHTENNEVTSEDCAKQGILLYIREESDPIAHLQRRESGTEYPMGWVHDYFDNFPLVPGEFKLPADFCAEKDSSCKEDLQDFSAKLQAPINESPEMVASAKEQSLKEIALFALRHKRILGLPENSFTKMYLEHISKHVSSEKPTYTPYNFCGQLVTPIIYFGY